jgi:hypothetical protein
MGAFALPIMAIASIGSAAVGGIEAYQSSEAQEAALEEQKKQVAAQTRSKQIQNLERVNQTLGNQLVIGSASGYDLSSTSFNAVSEDTLNKYAQDKDADALSASYQQSAIDQQIENAQSAGTMGLAGGFLQAGSAAIDLYGNKLFPSHADAKTAIGKQLAGNQMAEAGVGGVGTAMDVGLNYNAYSLPSLSQVWGGY